VLGRSVRWDGAASIVFGRSSLPPRIAAAVSGCRRRPAYLGQGLAAGNQTPMAETIDRVVASGLATRGMPAWTVPYVSSLADGAITEGRRRYAASESSSRYGTAVAVGVRQAANGRLWVAAGDTGECARMPPKWRLLATYIHPSAASSTTSWPRGGLRHGLERPAARRRPSARMAPARPISCHDPYPDWRPRVPGGCLRASGIVAAPAGSSSCNPRPAACSGGPGHGRTGHRLGRSRPPGDGLELRDATVRLGSGRSSPASSWTRADIATLLASLLGGLDVPTLALAGEDLWIVNAASGPRRPRDGVLAERLAGRRAARDVAAGAGPLVAQAEVDSAA
jgi:hypothetical protein